VEWLNAHTTEKKYVRMDEALQKVCIACFLLLIKPHSYIQLDELPHEDCAGVPLEAPEVSETVVRNVLKNHDFVMRSAQSVESERLITAAQLKEFFDTIGKIHVLYPPSLTYNWDETSGRLTKKLRLKLITRRGAAKPHIAEWPIREVNTTAGLFINAAGAMVGQLQVILPLKYVPSFKNSRILDSIDVHYQANGWVSSAIMLNIIRKVFIPAVGAERAFLRTPDARAPLYIDGHASHKPSSSWSCLLPTTSTCKCWLPIRPT